MKIYALDCETDPFEHGVIPTPFIWGLYDGKDFFKTFEIDEIINKIKSLPPNSIVYAHNGGKFDFIYLTHFFNLGKTIKIIGGRIAVAHIGKVELRDSYCLIPCALNKINKQPFNYELLKKAFRYKNMDAIIDYLKSDCVHLYNALHSFIQTYGLNLTIASTALSFYEGNTSKVRRSSPLFYNKFKPYYQGGMVECFTSGEIEGDILYLDINSAYPHAMTFEHPSNTAYLKTNKWSKKPQDFISLRYNISEKLVKNPKLKTLLKYFQEREILHITGWELLTFLKHNIISIKEIIECFTFKKVDTFSNYVKHFYKLRRHAIEKNDIHQSTFAKLMLNSLYGKFAQNPEKYKDYAVVDSSNMKEYREQGFELCSAQFSWDKHLFHRKSRTGKFLNVATAASITGCVRSKLMDAILSVETPLYCDTDSLFFIGKNILPISDKLGDWKVEGKVKKIYIAGKKLYSAELENGEFKTASKGGSLTPEEIKRVALGETIVYKPIAPVYSYKKGIYFQNITFTKTACL